MRKLMRISVCSLFLFVVTACTSKIPVTVLPASDDTVSLQAGADREQKTVSQTPLSTPKAKDEVFAEFFPLGREISVDLNGDRQKEKVFYDVNDLRINGRKFESDTLDNIYFFSPVTEHFIIADIDASDKQKEIGLKVMGPSDDPEVYFFTYQENELVFLGSVPSLIQNLEHSFDGKGSIKGVKRLEILQTWYAPAAWHLNEDNKIVPTAQDLYYPVDYKWQEEIILKEPLPIYDSRREEDPSGMMHPQRVDFLATDNKQWVQIEGQDGTKGWFRMNGFSEVDDLDKDAIEVFDNLSMAD